MNPKVPIIIPCKNIDPQTLECIEGCNKLDYRKIEILVLPDQNTTLSLDVTVISTGEVSRDSDINFISVKNAWHSAQPSRCLFSSLLKISTPRFSDIFSSIFSHFITSPVTFQLLPQFLNRFLIISLNR